MKLKTAFVATSLLIGGASISNAASFIVSNLVDLATDTLYQDAAGDLLTGGAVTIGYFASGVVITSQQDIIDNLASYVTLDLAIAGDTALALGSNVAGYAINASGTPTDIGTVTTGNALLGRTIYSLIGDASTLGASTIFAAVDLGTIKDDNPDAFSYSSNPTGFNIVVGKAGTWTGDLGFGAGSTTYNTVQFVPEPSAALLGAFGVLGLLRRRRA